MDGFTMATFLTDVGTILTSAVGWVGTVAGMVVNNPIMLVTVATGFMYTGVNLFKKFTR